MRFPSIPRTARPTFAQAENAGYLAGCNGPNTMNCNFIFFSTPDLTNAWERGNARGKLDKLLEGNAERKTDIGALAFREDQ